MTTKQTTVGMQWQEANPLTGSRYEVDASGYGNLQERDPLGANTGITDPYEPQGEDPVNPKYSSLVNSEQSLFLDGGGDPFNPKGGCELDGMPIDCGRLQQRADGGSVGADIIGSNGRLSRHVYLTGSDISIGGGSLSVYIPGRNDAPPPLGQDNGGAYGTLDRWETFYFAEVRMSYVGYNFGNESNTPRDKFNDCFNAAGLPELFRNKLEAISKMV